MLTALGDQSDTNSEQPVEDCEVTDDDSISSDYQMVQNPSVEESTENGHLWFDNNGDHQMEPNPPVELNAENEDFDVTDDQSIKGTSNCTDSDPEMEELCGWPSE